jgi:hypothetical protein
MDSIYSRIFSKARAQSLSLITGSTAVFLKFSSQVTETAHQSKVNETQTGLAGHYFLLLEVKHTNLKVGLVPDMLVTYAVPVPTMALPHGQFKCLMRFSTSSSPLKYAISSKERTPASLVIMSFI